MVNPHHRRFKASLAAALVAAACWAWLPGTALDRATFGIVARGFANPPFFISGEGKQEEPWKLRTFDSKTKTDARHAPVVVSLDDDLEGFFQSSPPSPVDVAVILSNLQRLGVNKAASGAVLAWSAPDPIGLLALDKVISRFDSLVMAAPLSRGAVPEPMPQAFRNASLPLNTIGGDASLLPAVNRLPVSGVILGLENTMAGFQSLESEKPTGRTPLLARWDDRVVFAFPLLAVMRHLDLPLDGVEIQLGDFLRLSPQGPTVPIDSFGRLDVPLKPIPPLMVIRAETLIDADEDVFPKAARGPLVVRDDRSASEPSTRDFSRDMAATIAAISSDAGLSKTQAFPRLPTHWEAIILMLPMVMAFITGGIAPFTRHVVFMVMAGLVIAAQVLAAGSAHAWLPGLPCMAAFLTAWIIGPSRKLDANVMPSPQRLQTLEPGRAEELSTSTMLPVVESPLPPAADMEPEPAPEPAPQKKTPTRKIPAKKTISKKTSTPKKPSAKETNPPKPPAKGKKRKS